jgi:hypothetical protein
MENQEKLLRIDEITDETRRDWESQEIYPVSLRRVLKSDMPRKDKPESEAPVSS